MPRHVVQSLHRRCALAPWRSSSTHIQPRRHYSEEPTETPPSSSSREETLHLLRVGDQKFLRECKSQIDDFIGHIKKAKEAVQAIPLTVQVDSQSGIPPYQLGHPRTQFQKAVPERADHTIDAAQTVKDHLIDLQYEPYKDTAENPLVEFEKSIEGWPREKKEQQSKEWQFQLEADLARLGRTARMLYEAYQHANDQYGNGSTRSSTASFRRATDERSSADARREIGSFKDAREDETSSKTAKKIAKGPFFQQVMRESPFTEAGREEGPFKDVRQDETSPVDNRQVIRKYSAGRASTSTLDLKSLQAQLATSVNNNPK